MQRITKLVPTNHPVSFTFVIMLREAFFCLSDLPGIQLYYRDGCDKDALVLYRCCRGTSDVEGSVHQKLTEFRPILAAILDIFWNFFMYIDILLCASSFKKRVLLSALLLKLLFFIDMVSAYRPFCVRINSLYSISLRLFE